MKALRAWFWVAAGAMVIIGGCVSTVKNPGGDTARAERDRRDLAEAAIGQWSNTSRLAARGLIEEYGIPDEVRFGRLIWNRNGPWKRTVVRDVRPAYVEGDDLGIVEQAVDYALPRVHAADLAALGGGVSYNPRKGELSSRADREELNFLRLNLADDVVRGNLSAEQARNSYAAIVSLEASGRDSPYLHGLRFKRAP